MGWTGKHREPGMTDREFFEQELPKTLTEVGRIIDCATVHNTFYAVVENGPDAYQPNTTWIMVVLMQRTRDWYNLTYKEMDEAMGPAESSCPRRLLELLESRVPTPPNDWAAQWRARCWDEAHRTEQAREVKRGTIVHFLKPLRFTDGATLSTLQFDQRSTFIDPERGCRYHVTGWRTREWEVIAS